MKSLLICLKVVSYGGKPQDETPPRCSLLFSLQSSSLCTSSFVCGRGIWAWCRLVVFVIWFSLFVVALGIWSTFASDGSADEFQSAADMHPSTLHLPSHSLHQPSNSGGVSRVHDGIIGLDSGVTARGPVFGTRFPLSQLALCMARYVLLQMGVFSESAELMYNDMSSVVFGSRREGTDDEVGVCSYPRKVSTFDLIFLDPLKMKLFVLFVVLQMTVVPLLRWNFSILKRSPLDFTSEYIPVLVVLLCLFGWVHFVIIYGPVDGAHFMGFHGAHPHRSFRVH